MLFKPEDGAQIGGGAQFSPADSAQHQQPAIGRPTAAAAPRFAPTAAARASVARWLLAAMSLSPVFLAFFWALVLFATASVLMLFSGHFHWLAGLGLCVAGFAACWPRAKRGAQAVLDHERARLAPDAWGRLGADGREPGSNTCVAVTIALLVVVPFLAMIGYFH